VEQLSQRCELAVILYLETNFLIGFAKGQDPYLKRLLEEDRQIQFVIPAVCYMESFSVLKSERKLPGNFQKTRDRFDTQLLKPEINEAKRNNSSENARDLCTLLQQTQSFLEEAQVKRGGLFRDIQEQLFKLLERLADRAEIADLTKEILLQSLNDLIIGEPTDNLILHTLLCHARSHPDSIKLFLSNNTKEFKQSEVSAVLKDVGIEYFSDTRGLIKRLDKVL
jgi:PIN domain